MLSRNRFTFAVLLTAVVACVPPPVSSTRIGGVFPANPETCPLELRLGGAATDDLVRNYTMVGSVSVKGDEGEPANAPRLLALIKPEACGLGGEVVLLVTSVNYEPRRTGLNESHHNFLVYRKNGPAPASQMF